MSAALPAVLPTDSLAAPSRPPRRRRALGAAALALVALAGLAAAAFAPIAPPASRDELFEIPRGTWARRMAGEKVEILPPTITLTLGVNDVLLLRNADDVPQTFGPALIMPGQSFRLPFSVASTYGFACSAHASGQLAVVVEPSPAPGWERLSWRLRRIARL